MVSHVVILSQTRLRLLEDRCPVPVSSAVAQLALIQSTLDPDVIRIAPPPPAGDQDASPIVAVVTDHDGQSALVIGDAPTRTVGSLRDLRRRTVDRGTLLAEPTATDLRMIWTCATRSYAPGDQVRVLQSDNGNASLIEAAQAATASVDGLATVLALACRGLVELDLTEGPLGPETRVRRHHPDTR